MSAILGKLFAKKKLSTIDIGPPTDMRQHIHVTKNQETGHLEGLPESWSKSWNRLSSGKQTEDPDVALQTAKFYTTIEDKTPEELSKPHHIEVTKKGEEEEDIFKKSRWSTGPPDNK